MNLIFSPISTTIIRGRYAVHWLPKTASRSAFWPVERSHWSGARCGARSGIFRICVTPRTPAELVEASHEILAADAVIVGSAPQILLRERLREGN